MNWIITSATSDTDSNPEKHKPNNIMKTSVSQSAPFKCGKRRKHRRRHHCHFNTQGDVTSQNLWLQNYRHFVGKEYPSEYNRLRLVFLLPYLSSWGPLLRICISKTASQIFTKFSGFWGVPRGPRIPQNPRDLTLHSVWS